MSDNPAQLLNLTSGRLAIGYEANFILVDTKEKWIVDSNCFFSKGKASPQNGAKLTGRVHATFFGGKKVFEL